MQAIESFKVIINQSITLTVGFTLGVVTVFSLTSAIIFLEQRKVASLTESYYTLSANCTINKSPLTHEGKRLVKSRYAKTSD